MWAIPKIPPLTILRDEYFSSVRFIVIRAPLSLVAYVGVPLNHPLAGFSSGQIPLSCHGGLTLSGEGDDDPLPKDFYWYGWDYSHGGDAKTIFYDISGNFNGDIENLDYEWTVGEVVQAAQEACVQFRTLMELIELMTNKTLASEVKGVGGVAPPNGVRRLLNI